MCKSGDERTKSKLKFVGLHAHSVAGSPFDGLGYPQEHMDYAFKNGCDALALTDHGNCNGLPYQVLHAKKMEKEGKIFKPIYGIEAYFIDSIEEWRKEVDKLKELAEAKKESQSATIIENDDDMQKQFKSMLKKRCHLLLLVQNQEGLNNLFKMVSESFKPENFYRYPRIDYKLLEKYNKGIIATSACVGGAYGRHVWEFQEDGDNAVWKAISNTTDRMIDIFKDRWYGELQWNNIPEQHKLNQMTIEMARERDFKLISTADSHYPNPKAWKNREIYRKLAYINRPTRPAWVDDDMPCSVNEIGFELYPKNGDQMWDAYKKYSKEVGETYDDDLIRESIERTHDIAHNKIEKFYPDNTVRLPDFVVPEGKDEDKALAEAAIKGLKERNLHLKENYVKQLKHELYVIRDRGFSKYFLMMKAISDRAAALQIVGPGRGSGAGALTSYVLGITQVDPIKWDLQFSRFLRRDATDYPDIDYDVSDPMDLKDILIEEWGEDKVAPISNWNTLQLKSLIKDISKFYDIPFAEVNSVTGIMIKEATPEAKKKHGIKSGVYVPTFDEVMEYSGTLQVFLEKYPQVEEHVNALYGQIRGASRHAGGVVIAQELDKYMPLITNGGVRQTPWSEGQNVRHLEPMGFIKFDILGLASLRMIHTCIVHILKRYHNNPNPTFDDVLWFYNENLHPDIIDFDDQKVYENVFHKGKWAGIFQFTESGAQGFCQRAKPRSLIDIAAVTSIYRPGPLGEGVDEKYVEAKENPEDIQYINDIFKEVTQSTYGFLIFQEQIAALAHKLGKNISLDEGNLLRKLLTKKGTGKGVEEKDMIHGKFIAGCEEKGISRAKAQKIWETFEYFSGYGFNKSHAVCYSVLSYQCAYLLTYYPSEWVASFLDKEPEKRKEKAINIARSMGFKIEPIDINLSGKVWEIDPSDSKVLVQPLSSIKGIGDAAIDKIMEHRPFDSLEGLIFNEEMIRNKSYSKVNKKCFDALIKTQALNKLIKPHPTIKHAKHLWHVICDGVSRSTLSLKKYNKRIEMYSQEEDFTDEEKIEYQVSLSGVFPMTMVLNDVVRDRLEEYQVPPISEFDKDLLVTWFIPREVIKRKTKNKKDYYIVKVTDINNVSETIKVWGVDTSRDFIFVNHPYMAKLEHSEKWGFSCRNMRKNFKLLG